MRLSKVLKQAGTAAASLWLAWPDAALQAKPADFRGILSGDQNYLQNCVVKRQRNGPHLVITMARQSAGDALRIENDGEGTSYDYLFPSAGSRAARARVVLPKLTSMSRLDIPMRTAMGLEGSKRSRIFKTRGAYTIFIGYGFRAGDEAEIYGACRVIYRP